MFYYFREKDKGNRSKAGYKLSSQRTKLQLGLRIKCIFSKRKPSRVLFTVECTDAGWQIKAMLSNIEKYKDALDHCSDNLIHLIKTAYDCHKCNNHCKGPNPFTIDGIEYRKCLGCSFYFPKLDCADQESLLALIKREAVY